MKILRHNKDVFIKEEREDMKIEEDTTDVYRSVT